MSKKLLLLLISAAIPWTANASFCTTYSLDHGTGVCVNASAAAGTAPNTSNALSASAVFELSGSNLNVTLINDVSLPANANQLGGADILTALLFNITNVGGQEITMSPAAIGLTPSLSTSPSNPLGTAVVTSPGSASQLKNYWALGSDSNYASNEAVLTATGLVGNTQKGNFGCGASCAVLGGPQWGIMPSLAPGGVASGLNPLVKNFIFFTLSGLSGTGLTTANLSSHISNVVFQYGTSFSEPDLRPGTTQAVPEPSFLVLLLPAFAALMVWRRRKQACA